MASRILSGDSAASVDDRVRAVVRILLGASDMKPADLARQVGMTRAQVWDRQRGDKAWTVQEVAMLAELFDVSVGVFYAGPDAILGRTTSTSKTRTALTGVSSDLAPAAGTTQRTSLPRAGVSWAVAA